MKIYICTHRQHGKNRVCITGSLKSAISWTMYHARETKKDKDATASQKIQGWKLSGTAFENALCAMQLGASLGDEISSVEIDGPSMAVLKLDQEREVSDGKVREWRFRG